MEGDKKGCSGPSESRDLKGVSPAFARVADRIQVRALKLFAAAIRSQLEQMPMVLIAVDKTHTKFESALIQFEDSKEKSFAFGQFLTRLQTKSFDLGGLFMVSEAWIGVANKDQPRSEWVQPSKDPNRVEALLIGGADKENGYRFTRTLGIARDNKGNPIGLQEIKMSSVPDDAMNEMTSHFEVKSKADREEAPEITDRAFNMWDLLSLSRPLLEKGVPFAEIVETLTEQEGIDFSDQKYFP